MSSLPTLYKKNERGKYQQWRTWSEGHVIHTEYGQVAGKLIHTTREAKPTNVGRANARDATQQAAFEAQSKWREQQEKKMYRPDPPSGGVVPSGVASGVASNAEETKTVDAHSTADSDGLDCRCCLADKYNDKTPSAFPLYTQVKMDGLRSVLRRKGETTVAVSRNLKEYPFLLHAKKAVTPLLEAISKELGCPVGIDGEMYSHRLTFNQITSIARKTKTQDPNEEKLTLHVFDFMSTTPIPDYAKRWEILAKHLPRVQDEKELEDFTGPVVLVPYRTAKSHEEVLQHHREYCTLGYEGSIIRTPNQPYVHKRTPSVLKLKDFIDEEATIVDAEEGEGTEKGCVVWVCENKQGARFKARPRGTRECRQEQYTNRVNYIGKQLTYRYQETTPDGIPRFPVGIAIRDYE